MRKMYKSVRLYMHYVTMNVRCVMQYKTSFLLTVVGK